MQEWIFGILEHFGYVGVFLLIALENLFPPIPSEVILTFSGYLTTKTNLQLIPVIISATLGSLVGALMLYYLGSLLGADRIRLLLKNYGKFIFLQPRDAQKSINVYTRYHKGTVFFCRFVPLLRSLISLPAGMAKMRLDTFLLLTALGSLIWNTVLIFLGAHAQQAWQSVADAFGIFSHYALVVLLSITALLLCLFVYHKLARQKKLWLFFGARLGFAKIAPYFSCKYIGQSYDALCIGKQISRADLRKNPQHSLDMLYRCAKFYENQLASTNLTNNMLSYLPQQDHIAVMLCALLHDYAPMQGLKEYLLRLYYQLWIGGYAYDKQQEVTQQLLRHTKKGVPLSTLKDKIHRFCSAQDIKLIHAAELTELNKLEYGKALLLYLHYKTNESHIYKDDYKIKAQKHQDFFRLYYKKTRLEMAQPQLLAELLG